MNRKNRGWISLALKTNALILAITFVLAAGLTTIAYYVNSERVDRYFKQTTSQAAAAVAAFMDGDYVGRLREEIGSDEFQQIRSAAVEAEDESSIISWLMEKGLYDRFTQISETLTLYKEKLGAKFVYLQSLEGSQSVNLIDPDEDMLYVGSIEISPVEFGKYQKNMRIEPTVSTTEFGWLCSAYEPVLDSEGLGIQNFRGDFGFHDGWNEGFVSSWLFSLQPPSLVWRFPPRLWEWWRLPRPTPLP